MSPSRHSQSRSRTPSPHHSPNEVTSLLPSSSRPRTPSTATSNISTIHPPSHARTISMGQRSVAGSVRGYGAVPTTPGPADQVPRVSKLGQRRVLTTLPIQACFAVLVTLTFLSVVLTLLLLLNTVLDLNGILIPYRGSGFAEIWFSVVGSWIGLGGVLFFSHPSQLFFSTTLLTTIFHIPILLLLLINPKLNRSHSPMFLIPFVLTALTLAVTLLSNYLVRRARRRESQRITRMLTEAAARERSDEEHTARAGLGLDKGISGRVVGFIFGVIGLLAGLAGLVLVLLLLVDLSISAYDTTTPLPSAASKLYTVKQNPWPLRIHLACMDPPDPTNTTRDGRTASMPTVLYEPPSGVPGSLALLKNPLPPASLESENPGNWLIEMQARGEIGRVCVWDRPGYGFSEVLNGADLGLVADTLYQVLESAGELRQEGLMLFGEGYGSLVARVFASRHPDLIHSFVHAEAETATTYFNESPNGLSVPALTAHRLATRLFPSLLTPLSVFRFPSVIFRRSTSRSRILASTRPSPNTAYLAEHLQKARLQETFASHSHTSSSFRALLESGDDYPSRKRAVVISSAERMESDERWEAGQRSLAQEVTDESGLVAWEKVKGVGHEVCEGKGREVCERSVRRLMKRGLRNPSRKL